MKVVLFGATGLLGRALVLRLARDGHQLFAWVRDPRRARNRLGTDVTLVAASRQDGAVRDLLEGMDAVVNLAGEPIAQRWTSDVRAHLRSSRVGLAERILQAVRQCAQPPSLWLQASAVGYYGDRGDEILDESSSAGSDFLAELCQAWESPCQQATALGLRTLCVRLGVVLADDGGALPLIAQPARFAMGAVLGDGCQFMPWIHIEDAAEVFATALGDDRYSGVANAVAPEAVRQRAFVDRMCAVLGRPRMLRVPKMAIVLAMGGAAQVVLGSQRVAAARLNELGFAYRFGSLDDALVDLLRSDNEIRIVTAQTWPDHTYLRERPPKWCLTAQVELAASVDEVGQFFADVHNLPALTPPSMGFQNVGDVPTPAPVNAIIDHRIRLGPARIGWQTQIAEVRGPTGFSDCQLSGPYRSWFHRHEFCARSSGARVIDEVWYALPFGILGTLVHRWFVAPKLRAIFAHRTRCARLRFGRGDALGHPLDSAAQT